MNTESLEKLCKIVERQIDKAVDVLDREGGKLPENDAKYLDTLTHTLKSIKTTLAMEGYGNSERRDSMGRYTSRADGYSDRGYISDGRSMHGDEVRESLQRMMEQTSDERVKRALREAMREM
jgi:hypothetical protein